MAAQTADAGRQGALVFGDSGREATIQVRFLDFHREHPEVYDALVRFTREAVAAGRTRVGMKMVWERVRWHVYVEQGGSAFKLNNNYHSRYARLIMGLESDLEGIFEVRRLHSQ